MEVERLRVAKFYHYFHSKKGMWGTRNMFNARSGWQRFDEDTEIITLYNETREKEEAKRIPRLYWSDLYDVGSSQGLENK